MTSTRRRSPAGSNRETPTPTSGCKTSWGPRASSAASAFFRRCAALDDLACVKGPDDAKACAGRTFAWLSRARCACAGYGTQADLDVRIGQPLRRHAGPRARALMAAIFAAPASYNATSDDRRSPGWGRSERRWPALGRISARASSTATPTMRCTNRRPTTSVSAMLGTDWGPRGVADLEHKSARRSRCPLTVIRE